MRVGRRLKNAPLIAAFAIVALLFGAGLARAATATWTGGGATQFWTDSANWTGNVAPSAGDDLVFPGGAARLINSNDFPVGTQFNSVSFTGASGGYNLGGNGIQLVAGINASNSAGTNTVGVPIQLVASQTFSCSIPGGTDHLSIAGGVALGSFTLTFTGSGFFTVDSAAISGNGGVTSSSIVFIGTNCTYTGATTVASGNFILDAAALAPSSVVTVNGGALLQFANGGSAGPVTVNAGGSIGFEGGGSSQIGNVTDLTMQSASTFVAAMYSASNYGQLNASGNVDLGGTTLFLFWGFASSTGETFTILNKTSAGAITGTFAGLPEGSTFTGNGRTYQITYLGGTGNDVVVTDIGPAPTATPTPTVTPTPVVTAAPTPTVPPTPPSQAIPAASNIGLAVMAVALVLAAVVLLYSHNG